MPLEISAETQEMLTRNTQAQGLDVETYLRRLIAAEEADFASLVEEGLRDVKAGRIRPAREALAELGTKLGFPC